jgi:hypothetical protein
MPKFSCTRLDIALRLLGSSYPDEPQLVDLTGEGRTPILDENWVVVDQLPAPDELYLNITDVVLGIVKSSDDVSPC